MANSHGESGYEVNVNNWFPYHEKENIDKITTYFQCQTVNASHLCIHTAATKLTLESDSGFSIGGTYNKDKEEFWFFGNVSVCHGYNYLLKLFMVFRKNCKISLSLPSVQNNLTERIEVINGPEKYCMITGLTKEYRYTASKKDEIVFVKTFCFTKDDIQKIGSHTLLVPCSIKVHDSFWINPDIVNKIKLQYTVQINETLYKARRDGDFTLISASQTEYPVHQFVAAAHSPVLRDLIRNNKKTYCLNMSDEDVEMLIGFLYTGSVENHALEKVPKLLEVADMLGLPGLFEIGVLMLSVSLNEDNAVDTAILAKKYNLKKLSTSVFHFVKHNPIVLSSSSMQNLNDIDLIKSMLQYVGTPCQCDKKDKQMLESMVL